MRRLRKLGMNNSGNEKSDESPSANNHQITADGTTDNNSSSTIVGNVQNDKNVVLSGNVIIL